MFARMLTFWAILENVLASVGSENQLQPSALIVASAVSCPREGNGNIDKNSTRASTPAVAACISA